MVSFVFRLIKQLESELLLFVFTSFLVILGVTFLYLLSCFLNMVYFLLNLSVGFACGRRKFFFCFNKKCLWSWFCLVLFKFVFNLIIQQEKLIKTYLSALYRNKNNSKTYDNYQQNNQLKTNHFSCFN